MAADLVDIEDASQLVRYLRATGRIGGDEQPDIRTLAGGVSNKTVWVGRETGEQWVLKQALPKLRTKVDWFSDPARIRREALGLWWLMTLAPAGTITPLLFEDAEQFLFAMEAVRQPHENWKQMLLAGDVRDDHVQKFGRLLGHIHRKAAERHQALSQVFDDRSFFESLRVEPYYVYTAKQVPAAAVFLNRLIEETRAVRHTLVHGDYSPKNILVHQKKLILLDHEVIHWGDGAFDLGFGLSHLLSKAHHVRPSREAFLVAAATFWTAYREAAWGVPPEFEARVVCHALGCLLARVAGRSTLEYLDEAERRRQAEVIVKLMNESPGPKMVAELSVRFVGALEN